MKENSINQLDYSFNPETDILFEDNHIIAINKKPSQIVQGDKTGDIPLSEIIKQFIKEKYNKPGNVFLGVTHRIDRPVSGLVLFAKTDKALSRLNKMFQDKTITKTYLAIVENKPPKDKDTLIHYLKKNQSKNITTAFNKEVPNSQYSELDYKLIKTLDNYFVLEINPKTGRPHQIRVQLASIGCSIKGDVKYKAKRGNNDKSICLHAYKINLIHPVSKEELTITAPLPNNSIWEAIS